MNIKKMDIKKMNDFATIPIQSSDMAAGYDLYAAIDEAIIIPPRTTKKIGTGIALDIWDGYFGAIFARSGLATNQGLRLANSVGVIDSDYRGELIVALHNDTEEERTISPGDRIAQLVIIPFASAVFNLVDELEDTERGDGGFGSTGL